MHDDSIAFLAIHVLNSSIIITKNYLKTHIVTRILYSHLKQLW